jgi:hypothetical protein
MGVTLVGTPVPATADECPPAKPSAACFYELTENLKFFQRGKPNVPAANRRIATLSALTGVASLGSPLCPVPDFESACTVNVQGEDNISLVTGLGIFLGHSATVVHGDNPFDGPELVELRGEFRGDMDFAPAILHQIPYGTVVGRFRPSGGPRTDFTGVFRLPFDGNAEVEVEGVSLTLRQIFCPNDPVNPNVELYPELYKGVDLKYLGTTLTDGKQVPNGTCIDIEPKELSLGTALVRFEIEF